MIKPFHFASLIIIPLLMLAGDAAALCVTSTQANLRSGPGTRYQTTWEVYKFMPLRQIARKGSWLRVKDVDGDRHWIHKSLVSNRINCAVVKGAKANVRTGPGTKFRKTHWSPAETYYSFKTIGSNGRWLKVTDEVGNSGWIAKSLLWRQ